LINVKHILDKLADIRILDDKCGPLTEKEFEEIKRHTILGYEMLNNHDVYDALTADRVYFVNRILTHRKRLSR